jgi:hypothetical protein
VRDVYDAHGLAFCRRVTEQRAAIGDTSRNEPLIEILERITAGFREWEQRYHSATAVKE